jgi:molecular chaperone Hsp33
VCPARSAGRAGAPGGPVDQADLLRVQVVFRHVGEPPKRADSARARCASRFPPKPRDAARQRGFPRGRCRRRAIAVRAPDRPACVSNSRPSPRQQRIGPGPRDVSLPKGAGFPESADHAGAPFACVACRSYMSRYAKLRRTRKPHDFRRKLAWDDTSCPSSLMPRTCAAAWRGSMGCSTGVLRQHDYPPPVEALVAEMALLTALIGQTIKLRWKLSLQVQTNGPVRMIATDYFAPKSRASPRASGPMPAMTATRMTDAPPFLQLGEGYFAILIDQGRGQPYQGITPINGDAVAIAPRPISRSPNSCRRGSPCALAARPSPAGPSIGARGASCCSTCPRRRPSCRPMAAARTGAEPKTSWMATTGEKLDPGEHAPARHGRGLELIGPAVPPTDLLVRLFHEEQPRVFDASRCASAAPARRIACGKACRSIRPRTSSI